MGMVVRAQLRRPLHYATLNFLHAGKGSWQRESRLIREKASAARPIFDLSYTNEERTPVRAQANRMSNLISSWNYRKVAAIQISDIPQPSCANRIIHSTSASNTVSQYANLHQRCIDQFS